jgi:hypothetical protein
MLAGIAEAMFFRGVVGPIPNTRELGSSQTRRATPLFRVPVLGSLVLHGSAATVAKLQFIASVGAPKPSKTDLRTATLLGFVE